MTTKARRISGVAAVVNLLSFVLLLATRPPEYEWLRERDAERKSGGMQFMSSADPIHIAGRPFYSSAHTPVPLTEDLYFLANLPAHLAMIVIGLPLASVSHGLLTGEWLAPGAWESWVLATVFGVGCGLWGFVVGAMLSRWVPDSQGAA